MPSWRGVGGGLPAAGNDFERRRLDVRRTSLPHRVGAEDIGAVLVFTDTNGLPLVLPAAGALGKGFVVTFKNLTGGNLTVTLEAGDLDPAHGSSSFVIGAGIFDVVDFISDGVYWHPAAAAGSSGSGVASEAGVSTMGIGCYLNGIPASSEELVAIRTPIAFTLPVGLTGSKARARVAPTDADAVISIRKNNVEIGTVTISTSNVVSLASASGASFSIGDLLTIVAQETADSTLAGVNVTLLATRA
jgi:hypothetical protein